MVFDLVNPTQRAACPHTHQGVAYVCSKCQYLQVNQVTPLAGIPVSIKCPRTGCLGWMPRVYRKCMDCGQVLQYY
jgi:hypothetical protein